MYEINSCGGSNMYIDIQENAKRIFVKGDNRRYCIIEEAYIFVICSYIGNTKTLAYETFTHSVYDALLWIKHKENEISRCMMEQADKMHRMVIQNEKEVKKNDNIQNT